MVVVVVVVGGDNRGNCFRMVKYSVETDVYMVHSSCLAARVLYNTNCVHQQFYYGFVSIYYRRVPMAWSKVFGPPADVTLY